MSYPSSAKAEKSTERACQGPMAIVRIIVSDENGSVLILRRANTKHAPGQWCLPGGKAEHGISLSDSARKELYEETSLSCPDPIFLFHQESLPESPGDLHCINFYFACEAQGPVAINRESDDFAWIEPGDTGSRPLAFKNEEGLRRYWERG